MTRTVKNASEKSLIEAFFENYVKPKLTNESPLDKPILVTRFRDLRAKSCKVASKSLRQLAIDIKSTSAARKEKLPLIKLGRFGDVRTGRGSLRHDANLLSISGIEIDVDAGQLSPKLAAKRLEKAGIAGLVYSSPSHDPEHPKWRALCPCSAELPPAQRRKLVERLNRIFDGQVDPASLTASQSFYIGRVDGGSPVEVHFAEGGYVDQAARLDEISESSGHETRSETRPESRPESPGSSAYGRKALALEASAVANAPTGQRSNQLFKSAAALGQLIAGGELDEAEAERALFEAAEEAGLIADYSRRKVLSTIENGFMRGGKEPRTAPEPDVSLFDDLDDEADRPRGLTFLTPAECANAPRREYLVKGLLAKRDVGCIFGAPGAGKSLLAPYLGYMIAQGRSAFGSKTKQGGVFYVAAEDETGMCERIAALKLKHGDESNFRLVCGVFDLSRNSKHYAELKAAVAERKPSLIVIDTLAMAFPGLEENSAEAMSRVVAVARSLTKFGAAVLLIHHDTKAEGGTPRGHSVLNGALDMAMQVTQDEKGIVRGKLTKNRNGPCDLDIAFRIGVVEIGTDDDGEPQKSAVCEPLAALDEEDRERMSPAERAAFDILTGMMDSPSGVDARDWRDACVRSRSVSAAEKYDSRLKAFRRAAEGLTRKKWVEFSKGKFLPRNSSERRIIRSFEELDDDEII